MKKIYFTLVSAFMCVVALNAQTVGKSYEANGKYDKKISGSCVAITVNTDLKKAQSLMEDLLKNEGLKVQKKGSTLNYEKIIYQAISPEYLNLNIAFEAANKDKNSPATTVRCFLSKGAFGESEFVSSASDHSAIANLKNLLDTKYSYAVYNNDVEQRTEAKKKEIETATKEIEAQNKEIEKRSKDISGYKKDIDKANDNIKKAENDIETAKKTVETKKILLQKLNDELKQIK